MDCGKWLESRLDDYMKRKLNSYADKRRAFRRFFLDIDPATPVSQLSPAMVLTHLSRIAEEISGDRANRQRGHMTEAWKWGVRYLEMPTTNPFEGHEQFAKGKYKDKYVPPERDFWAVHASCIGQERLMLSILYYTGCRRNEAHEIKWEDVDLDGKKIRIGTCKGRAASWRYAWLAIPDELALDLKKHKLATAYDKPTDTVITGKRGGRIDDWSHLVQKLCRQAHVAEFGYHGIRHMVATKLWTEGHTVSQIQQFLRHESPQTTEIYLRSLGLYQTTEPLIDTLVRTKQGESQGESLTGSQKKVSQGPC